MDRLRELSRELGGDYPSDAGLLRAEPELLGPVGPDPVISRLITAPAGDVPRVLKAIRDAGPRASAHHARAGLDI